MRVISARTSWGGYELEARTSDACYFCSDQLGQLADLCNVKVTNISRYEMGSVKPNLDMIITLANVLNVSTDTLCGLQVTQDDKLVLLAKKACKLPKEKQQALTLVLEAFLKA